MTADPSGRGTKTLPECARGRRCFLLCCESSETLRFLPSSSPASFSASAAASSASSASTSSGVAVMARGRKASSQATSSPGGTSRTSGPDQKSLSMTGCSSQGESVGFLMAGRGLVSVCRTGPSKSIDPSWGSCDTQMPVRVTLRLSAPSMKRGTLSHRQSSLTLRGWKLNSIVVSSLGFRNPSIGSTLKSGAKAPGAHRHLVPMSPTFSS
mmetsp:Transcript_46679/g.113658  ORF Transcript_46679/g.113658 Transcript_46679/m.113658 type:complete len:211 (-) Transcript_46679:1888-2520(-)